MKPAWLLAALLSATPAFAQDNALQPSSTWVDLRESVIGLTEDPKTDENVLNLDAPPRAHDAAIVPIRITQPQDGPAVTDLMLVVDENPAPVAAELQFGSALMPLDFEIRLRVDAYGNVRALATTDKGQQVMAGRFVKASGGCSAPAGKDMAAVAASMGQMRWKHAEEDGRSIGTLMIRHPNFSGLQRDQVTLLNIPAHFIQRLEVRQGDDMLFTLEAGISISEDPVFRFAYRPNGEAIRVHVEDSEGNIWDQDFEVAG
jgi:sulfur-oxidizing protein SoxY